MLPPWSRLYHWKTRSIDQKHVPWSTFFDLPSLSQHVPVIEFKDFLASQYSLFCLLIVTRRPVVTEQLIWKFIGLNLQYVALVIILVWPGPSVLLHFYSHIYKNYIILVSVTTYNTISFTFIICQCHVSITKCLPFGTSLTHGQLGWWVIKLQLFIHSFQSWKGA